MTAAAKAAAAMQVPGFEQRAVVRNCLRLRTTIEVFQWVEKRVRPGQHWKDLVDGEEPRPSHTYTRQWSSEKHDSYEFADIRKKNIFLVEPGSQVVNCEKVEYDIDGGGFVLPEGLVEQFTHFRSAAHLLNTHSLRVPRSDGATAQIESPDDLLLVRRGDYFTTETLTDGLSVPPAEIGDVRVKFEYVPDGQTAAILAQQVPGEWPRDTFAPYEVNRGCMCCVGQAGDYADPAATLGKRGWMQPASQSSLFELVSGPPSGPDPLLAGVKQRAAVGRHVTTSTRFLGAVLSVGGAYLCFAWLLDFLKLELHMGAEDGPIMPTFVLALHTSVVLWLLAACAASAGPLPLRSAFFFTLALGTLALPVLL